MQPIHPAHRLAACALAGTLAIAAHATEQKAITNAHPASSVGPPTAVRTLKFDTRREVPATLTLRRETPIESGWKAQFRFAGQTDLHACSFKLPKTGQLVHRGETTVGTVKCETPWQLYDNGLAFEAFENTRKVADGTLRP
jgi:hypothetical protein